MSGARPFLPLAALVVLQWIVATVLIGFSLRAIVLTGLVTGLLVAAADAVAGRIVALAAGSFWVIAPAVLGFWRSDFRPHWHHGFLPVLYGARDSGRLLSGAALLAALLAVWRLRPPAGWLAAGALVLVAAVVVRVDQAAVAFHWSALGANLDWIREVGWSRRLVEYLPVAGIVGLGLRRPKAAVFVGAWFVLAVIVPLARSHGSIFTLSMLRAVVPGLPAYALLAGCIPLLLPTRLRIWETRA